MEEQELEKRLDALQEAVARTEKVSKRLYNIFLVMVIISVLAFVLPLIGLVFAIPSFIDTYTTINNIQ